jgi:hypothetical protein
MHEASRDTEQGLTHLIFKYMVILHVGTHDKCSSSWADEKENRDDLIREKEGSRGSFGRVYGRHLGYRAYSRLVYIHWGLRTS